MELRQVEYFVAVAEERHFGRAADRLHIGQPAVSQQIRRLERELGVDLLDRSPRHVRLTAAGERFLPEARAILAAVARARTSVSAIDQTLRLGTSTGLGSHLDRILDRLAAQAPSLTVELVSARTAERLAQVVRGELDAAFVRDSPAQEAPSDVALAEASGAGRRGQAAGEPALRHVPLWPDPLLAVLPARHPLAQAADVALADLAPLPVRLTDRRNNPALVDLLVTAFHDAGLELRPGPPTASLQDTHAAIGAAGGDPERATWTVVYASHASHLQNSRVAFLPFRETRLEMVTSLVVRRDKPTPHLAALLAACADDHDS